MRRAPGENGRGWGGADGTLLTPRRKFMSLSFRPNAHLFCLAARPQMRSPVASYPDPIRGGDNVLVMCEVFSPDNTPHPTNTRAKLRAILDKKACARSESDRLR